MLNDVEERTYEFAMLRTLGYENSSLAILLVIQTLFQSIPATSIGFILVYIFTQGTQILLSVYINIIVTVNFTNGQIILGLITGFLVPLISNIYPIK